MIGEFGTVQPTPAAADRGKEQLHRIVKEWAETLCVQLGYEAVITNPGKHLLVEQVREDLKQRGFLPPGGGLYADQDAREKDYVEEQISKTVFRFDEVGERTKKLESVFFGWQVNVVGDRTASNPNKTSDEKSRYLGRYLPAAGHIWKFKKEKPLAARNSAGGGIFKEPWDGGWFGKGDILKYLGAVVDDNKDAGQPGYQQLMELGGIYQMVWADEDLKDLQQNLFKGGTMNTTVASIGKGEHPAQQGTLSGGFFQLYADAFVALRDYAQALGWFSQECVDKKEKEFADTLIPILGLEIMQRDRELQRSVIKQAITGDKPIDPPDPIQNLRPFDFQCFLIENIVHLTDLRAPGTPGAPRYKNVSKLSTNNDPGTVLSRINHANQTEQVRALMSLCPEAYALLEPSIKIYRVDYAKDNPTKPTREQELHIPNFIDKADIDNMLGAQGGRATGYGLKSFQWSLAGVQPAEVDNNITANMKFYFQSIQDLFQGQLAAGQKEASPLDLIISSRASEIVRKNKTNKSVSAKPAKCGMLRNSINEEYQGANFRISARIGWNMPPNFATAFPSFSEKVGKTNKTKGTLLAEAIRNTRIHLFLQQTRHLIDFKEDGSVELDIQYQAALSGILKEERANILANDKTFFEEEIKGYQAKVKEEKEKGERADEARIDEILQEIQQLEIQDRNFKYKKFLEKLYTKNKVYNIGVQPAELLIPSWADLTPAQRASRAKRRLSPEEGERGFKVVANNNFDTSLLAAVTEVSKDPTKEESELEEQSVQNAQRFKDLSLSNETIMIPYFYLGDLLDLILETLPGYDDGEKFLFYMSEVELLNPLLAFQVKNLSQVLCTDKLNDAKFIAALRNSDPLRFKNVTKLQNIINIGDLPISLDAFNVWFKDNVIKKDRDNYYFLYFVKDVCSQLISNALRGDCFGNALKFDIRFDAAKIEMRKNANLKPGKSATVKQLASAKGALSSLATSIKKVLPSLIIYSTDSKPKSRRGKLDADLKVGIYHHYVGSSCSIVKSINFQREDQPYLREAKIQKQGALDATQLRELYSVNLELIGNTLYKNGQYIYVDPTMVMGDPTLSRLLGISGYYLVTSVDHSISDSGYDVKIRALQEGIDFDENSNPVSVQFMDSEVEGVPTWTPPEYTPEETAMMSGDHLDNAVDVVKEFTAETWANLKENYAEDFAVLTDGELNWEDARALVKTGTPWNSTEAQFRGLQASWAKWKENAELQGKSANEALDEVMGSN